MHPELDYRAIMPPRPFQCLAAPVPQPKQSKDNGGQHGPITDAIVFTFHTRLTNYRYNLISVLGPRDVGCWMFVQFAKPPTHFATVLRWPFTHNFILHFTDYIVTAVAVVTYILRTYFRRRDVV